MDHSYRRPPSRPDRSRTPPIRYHLTAPCTCRLPVRPRHPDAVTLRSDARPGAESRQRLLARSPYWLAGMRICLPASSLMAGGGNAGSLPLRHAAREGAEAVALRSARCHGAPPPFVIENDSVRMNQRKGRPCDKSESGSISAAPDHGGRPADHQPEDSADLVSRIGVVTAGDQGPVRLKDAN